MQFVRKVPIPSRCGLQLDDGDECDGGSREHLPSACVGQRHESIDDIALEVYGDKKKRKKEKKKKRGDQEPIDSQQKRNSYRESRGSKFSLSASSLDVNGMQDSGAHGGHAEGTLSRSESVCYAGDRKEATSVEQEAVPHGSLMHGHDDDHRMWTWVWGMQDEEELQTNDSDGSALSSSSGSQRTSRKTTPVLAHPDEDKLSRFFGRRKESVANQLGKSAKVGKTKKTSKTINISGDAITHGGPSSTTPPTSAVSPQWLASKSRKHSANPPVAQLGSSQSSVLPPACLSLSPRATRTLSSPLRLAEGMYMERGEASVEGASVPKSPLPDEERLAKFFGRRKESVATVLRHRDQLSAKKEGDESSESESEAKRLLMGSESGGDAGKSTSWKKLKAFRLSFGRGGKRDGDDMHQLDS